MNTDQRGYVYRSKREGGRVVREYIGRVGDEITDIAIFVDEVKAQERKEERQQTAATFHAWTEQDAQQIERLDVVMQLVRLAFVEAGYRRRSGEWRKMRATIMDESKNGKGVESAKDNRIQRLEKLANDPNAMSRTFDALRGTPDEGLLLSLFEDPSKRIQSHMAEAMGFRSPFEREALRRKIELKRSELGYEQAPALEQLLIEQIVVCYLEVNQLRIEIQNNTNPQLLEALDKRLTRSHKRYMTSIKTLADVRKVNLSIKINLANQQINL